jgi:hypothetical protein
LRNPTTSNEEPTRVMAIIQNRRVAKSIKKHLLAYSRVLRSSGK